jgi:hypothetical protein
MGLFKKIKRGWKKLGSSIAKRMRKIGRGVKKGFKKITKAFGKLGPLGHLALFFILPGMGNVMSSWMGQFGSKVMNMLPKGFANTLGTVGGAIKDVASFAYNNTIGAVYNTVSKALTTGIDFVTAPFMDGTGAATRFQNFVSDTAKKFSAPGEVPLTPEEVSAKARAESSLTPGSKANKELADLETTTGTIKPSKEAIARNKTLTENQKISAEARRRSEALLESTKPPTIDTPVTDKVASAKDTIASGEEKKSWYESYKDLKTGVSEKDIPGLGVNIGEATKVAKDATGVFSAYKYFNPDDMSGEFYNPNIGMANQLNESTDSFTMAGVDATFIPNVRTPSISDAATNYSKMFGQVGLDPVMTAINAPGYGYTFEDYVIGQAGESTYG